MRSSHRRLPFIALPKTLFLITMLCAGLAINANAQNIPGLPGDAAPAAQGFGVSENKLGSVLFFNFLVHDDQENTFSAQLPLSCFLTSDKQRVTSIRTVPNINTIAPSGRSSWATFSATGNRAISCGDGTGAQLRISNVPLMGATATRVGGFTGGHNLRYATVFNRPGFSITIPVLAPPCSSIDELPTMTSSLCQ